MRCETSFTQLHCVTWSWNLHSETYSPVSVLNHGGQDVKNLLWHFWCFLNYIDDKFNEKTREKQNRKIWCRSWISEKMCWVGYYHNLTNELKIEDKKGFKNFFRMSPNNFWFLANKVASCISRQNTIKFHITSINVLSVVPSSEGNAWNFTCLTKCLPSKHYTLLSVSAVWNVAR